MMRIAVFFGALLLAFPGLHAKALSLDVVPQPVSVRVLQGAGAFHLRPDLVIIAPAGTPEAAHVAAYLAKALAVPTGFRPRVAAPGEQRENAIMLEVSAWPEAPAVAGCYRLEVSTREVRIQSPSAEGLLYGVQTLLQLLPPEIASKTRREATWTIPSVQIVDYPRFRWRGLMLDVSRHFFSKEFIEKYIDAMARYKLNIFHWHLTDNNGWRIQIPGLPRLTEVGAWRVPRLGRWHHVEPPREGEAETYGGFYTADDIREVVAYARERFITVVPEIDIPGHSMAALAAYPELSCTGGPIPRDPGGMFPEEAVTHNLCPGKEKTFEFVDQVSSEVARLFPSAYIHFGGDECYKGFWNKCPDCKRRMASEHLANADELQSYFVRRVEKILETKGKRLIGWDEILEGGLAPNATVMSWRGMEGGLKAAALNHDVIMTPAEWAYLDAPENLIGLKTFYSFEPAPDGVDTKHILGGQGNLWTENVPNWRYAELMTWPRGFALAEVFWSPKASRNWDDFARRAEAQFPRLEAAEVNYGRALYDVRLAPERDVAGRLAVRMTTELGDCDIYYTVDGTPPDRFLPKYPGEPVTIPGDAEVVRAIAYRKGRPCGQEVSATVKELNARLLKKRTE